MPAAADAARRRISRLLHALGIRDRAWDDPLVLGLGTLIIFGLLVILAAKIALMRGPRLARERAAPRPGRTLARTAWQASAALAGIAALLAVSLLIALRLNS